MTCHVRNCPEPAIRDGRDCREHTNEFLRRTRLPEWRRRASERPSGLARDLTGIYG